MYGHEIVVEYEGPNIGSSGQSLRVGILRNPDSEKVKGSMS